MLLQLPKLCCQIRVSAVLYRTGGSFIEKSNKGHSPELPTLVVKWMETLSRDVTWLLSDA